MLRGLLSLALALLSFQLLAQHAAGEVNCTTPVAAPFRCARIASGAWKGHLKCGITDLADAAIPSAEAQTVGAFLIQILRAVMLSIFMNFSLFVGELAMLVNGPSEDVRRGIDGLCNILVGPVSVISFYYPDSLATLLFFGSLWHFLCDRAATRPTYLLLFPWQKPGRDSLRWFESCWILVHHTAMGTVKLGLDWGDIPPCPHPLLLFVFIVGAGFAHMSFGMQAFGITLPFCSPSTLFALSQLLRIAADVSIFVLLEMEDGDNTWKYLMAADFAWLMVMFVLRVCKSRRKQTPNLQTRGKSSSLRRADEDLAACVSPQQTREQELIDAAHGHTGGAKAGQQTSGQRGSV